MAEKEYKDLCVQLDAINERLKEKKHIVLVCTNALAGISATNLIDQELEKYCGIEKPEKKE